MGKTIRATAGSTGRKGKHIGRSDKKFPGGTQRGATDRAAQRAKRTQTRSNLARWEEGGMALMHKDVVKVKGGILNLLEAVVLCKSDTTM